MAIVSGKDLDRAIGRLRAALARIEVLALFPLLTLLAVALGYDDIVLVTALLLPGLLALQAVFRSGGAGVSLGEVQYAIAPARSGVPGQDALLAMLERITEMPQHDTACIVLQIDDWEDLVDRWGSEAADDIAQRASERLCTSLRHDDMVARLGDARFGIVLHPVLKARLGTREAIVNRIRGALGEAIPIAGGAARLTFSAGHTNLIRKAGDPAAATFAAAEAALAEAHREGPNAIRAYAPGLIRVRKIRSQLAEEVDGALSEGEIRPWFQPQICADTGVLSGFEALARWVHPERGVLVPGEFLQAIDDAGRMDTLGHTVLHHALEALQSWDAEGLRVPSVSVNFSTVELRNPALIDQVKWEIDRFDLRPGRLTVEILETVAADSAEDSVMATLSAFGAHGINLDLDDFGVGQASLAAIRRFGVSRIKIDRSFVLGLDTDPQQQSMVAAILAMAEHLGIETLAEGVETQAVQTLLAQMGCNHLQGFFVGRPMPFENTVTWASAHNAKLDQTPLIGRRVG